jgi:hypothetical protein
MQTLRTKWVKLYLVKGVKEESVKRLKKISEVQEAKWIPVSEFLRETLKFGMANPNQSQI